MGPELTKEDISASSMSKVTIIVILHIAHGKYIKLALASTAGDVNREKDRPCDQTADEACYRCNLQQPKEKITVERVVSQNMGIWKLEEGAHPVHQTGGECWRALPGKYTVSTASALM